MEVRLKDGTRVICFLLIGISLILYYITFSFPKESGPVGSRYGSAFFPRLMLAFIIVFAVILFLQATFRKLKPSAVKFIRLNRMQLARSLAVWTISLLFYWAWQYAGYLYVAPLYMIAIGFLLNVRNWKALVSLAAFGPLMYVVFEQLLKVGL